MAGEREDRDTGGVGTGEAAPVLVSPPRPRWRLAVGAVVVLLLAGLAAVVVAGIVAPRGASVTVAPGPDVTGSADDGGVLTVVVHVLGAVEEPGLYRLPEGSRIVDAVGAAGGFAADADRGALNLARVLSDAEQLVVPVIGAAALSLGPPGVGADGRVNINTADRAALETLPRVGPAMADRIVAWREENGGFRSVEDLREVSGIGERTFESLRELVAV